MKLLEKILVNVDLENTSYNHLEVAEKLADKFNSKIIFLCVLPKEATINSLKDYVKSYADDKLKSLTEHLSYPKEKIESRFEYGNAFEKIISVSELENVNLIINSVTQEALTSNSKVDILSEKLVRKSNKPIMIVNSNTNPIPENILCPVDFSESSERALSNAIKIARSFNSKLSIVNVFEPLGESFSKRLDFDFEEENKKLEASNKKQLNEFIGQFNLIDVEYSVISLSGKPAEVISNYALSNSIDMIFIGATGKNYIQRHLIGSVSEHLIRSTDVSMVVLKAVNLLELKIESDISTIEKHLDQAIKLEEAGFYQEAVDQLKTCLLINDLHLPVLSRISKVYSKIGEEEQAEYYNNKFHEVLRRLWDKKTESDLRKGLKF